MAPNTLAKYGTKCAVFAFLLLPTVSVSTEESSRDDLLLNLVRKAGCQIDASTAGRILSANGLPAKTYLKTEEHWKLVDCPTKPTWVFSHLNWLLAPDNALQDITLKYEMAPAVGIEPTTN